MKLFRVQMWGEDKTLQVFGAGSPPGASQFFQVEEGAGLQTIDFVEDMGRGALRFANGPETIRARSADVEELLRKND